mgnify:CR=1 FL=1
MNKHREETGAKQDHLRAIKATECERVEVFKGQHHLWIIDPFFQIFLLR